MKLVVHLLLMCFVHCLGAASSEECPNSSPSCLQSTPEEPSVEVSNDHSLLQFLQSAKLQEKNVPANNEAGDNTLIQSEEHSTSARRRRRFSRRRRFVGRRRFSTRRRRFGRRRRFTPVVIPTLPPHPPLPTTLPPHPPLPTTIPPHPPLPTIVPVTPGPNPDITTVAPTRPTVPPPNPDITTAAPPTVPPTTAAPPRGTRFPSDLMTRDCPTGGVLVTPQVGCQSRQAKYDAIVKDIHDQIETLDAKCEPDDCQRSDWVGCVLRFAGHDFMDFVKGAETGGSDGCIDMLDHDNKGVEGCMWNSEHKQKLSTTYCKHHKEVSLADFTVIAAEAVMSWAREFDKKQAPNKGKDSIDFKSNFRFGRKTNLKCKPPALPLADRGCDPVEEVFIKSNRLDMNWRQTAALMGVHSLGRTHTKNSGFNGPWSEIQQQARFNNNYYESLMFKGWVNKNFGDKSWWVRADLDGKDPQSQLMLDTDICLYYPRSNSNEMKKSNSECCAWTLTTEPNQGQDFCNGEFRTSPFGTVHKQCCKGANGGGCGSLTSFQGPASKDVRDFAKDDNKWLENFLAAWNAATEKGFNLQDKC